MLTAIAFFEIKNRLKRLSSLIYFLVFFTFAFLTMLHSGGGLDNFVLSIGIADKVYLNSPFALNIFITAFAGYFGILIVAPLFGQSVYKDFHCRMDPILFSSPIKQRNYLWGRWLASVVSCLVIFSGVALALWLVSLSPWVHKELFTENKLVNYLNPYLTTVIPNILIFGSLFFALVCKFKKMAPIYTLGILLLVSRQVAQSFLNDIDNKLLASLLDPFGVTAIQYLTEHWSVNELNVNSITWSHFYLYNRLLWLSIGLASFIYALFCFRYSSRARKRKEFFKEEILSVPHGGLPKITSVSLKFDFFSQIKRLLCLSFFEWRQAFKNVYFLVIYLSGILLLFVVGIQKSKGFLARFGGESLPVTYMLLNAFNEVFFLFVLILVTYYAGELIWRERNLKFHFISDALPYSNGISLMSKIFCMGLLQIVFLMTLLTCGVLIQTFKGYFHFELGLYLKDLFGIKLISWFLISLLGIFVHIAVNNKYLGHFILILCYVGIIYLPSFGFEHHLYLYGTSPEVIYSDMNGYGFHLKGFIWFSIYWSFFAAILAVLAYLLWPRGTVFTNSFFWREFRRRLSKPILTLLCLLCVSTISVGGFIYYNTNILNKYITSKKKKQFKYLYEFQYKKFEKIPSPALKKVAVEVDFFPYQKKIKVKGRYFFKNRSTQPIQTLFVNYPYQYVPDLSLNWSRPASLFEKNENLGVSIYKLEKPLNPGEELMLDFQMVIAYLGFTNEGPPSEIVPNGIFFRNEQYFPALGYNSFREISREKIRRKYKLPPKLSIPKIYEEKAKQYTALGPFLSSRVDFSATLSTSKDQIAIAPGYLQRKWKEGDRKYFHYKMDHPIWNYYAFLSGRYTVKRDQWKDVSIEIYHHLSHTQNLDRMVRAVKKGLDYFTREFSPYQHKQFRIIEFPRPRIFAQSFPNTIPYSEAAGFIANVKDKKDKNVDVVFYVTAHELAHQWWGHQVAGAYVQGSGMLMESMSQYSALMVMEKEYGHHKMKRFLKHELNLYLVGRGSEHKLEQPLMLVEPNQDYIAYSKGSLILYALKDYVGEKVLNSAIRKYIKKTAWQEAPYTTTDEFVMTLKDNVSKNLHNLIDDFFKYITFYDNKILKASAREKPNGGYVITLTASTKKWRSDGMGKQTEKPMDIPVDIGIRNKKGDFIYLKKHLINSEEEYLIEVDGEKGRPDKVGIDPLNKLIERNFADNEVFIQFKEFR